MKRGNRAVWLLFLGVMGSSLGLAYLSLRVLRYEELVNTQDARARARGVAANLAQRMRLVFAHYERDASSGIMTLRARDAQCATVLNAVRGLSYTALFVGGPGYRPVYPRLPWPEEAETDPFSQSFLSAYRAQERIEFGAGAESALPGYGVLLASASGRERAVIRNAIARCLRKTGRAGEATEMYERLAADCAGTRLPCGTALQPLALFEAFALRVASGEGADIPLTRLLRCLLSDTAPVLVAEARFFAGKLRAAGVSADAIPGGCGADALPLLAELEYLLACRSHAGQLLRARTQYIVDDLVKRGLGAAVDGAGYADLREQVERLLVSSSHAGASLEGEAGPARYFRLPGDVWAGATAVPGAQRESVIFVVAGATVRSALGRVVAQGTDQVGALHFRIREGPEIVGGSVPADAPFRAGVLEVLREFRPAFAVAVAARHGSEPGRTFRLRRLVSVGVILLLLTGSAVGVILMSYMLRRERELSQLKTAFISTVSHELRTPVTAIRMISEMLDMGGVPTPEKTQEYYRNLLEESERLAMLINNLLDFSRIDSGKKRYELIEQDIGPVFQDALRTFERYAGPRGYSVGVAVDPDLPVVRVDADAMVQVLMNLLDNAMKYSPDCKVIELRACASPERGLAVSVADHGRGIPNDEIERIFERFYRGRTDCTEEASGCGVGLAIVRETVAAHGGRVDVVSQPDAGTTFTVWLPAA